MKAIVQDTYGSADVLRLRTFIAREKAADLRALTQLAESGTLTPVIGRTYPLADAADAIRDIAAGHASGKGIITV
jgi:NADPH:quinone reductase-like Zn-dependent oxidoreductase